MAATEGEGAGGPPPAGRRGVPNPTRRMVAAARQGANPSVWDAGVAETKEALEQWRRNPWPVLGRWTAGSLCVTLVLLAATWFVATTTEPLYFGGVYGVFRPMRLEQFFHVLIGNSLVLALHSFACVAGFLAKRSLPMQAQFRTGVDRWVHEHAGGAAMLFVLGCTLFSLLLQAFVLGHAANDVSIALDIPPAMLLLSLLPHALPELVAVFLPLAAWLLAARAQEWNHLLAASIFATAVAFPVIVISAVIEGYVTPHLVRELFLH